MLNDASPVHLSLSPKFSYAASQALPPPQPPFPHVMTREWHRCENSFPEDRPSSRTSLILCTLSHHRHTPVISLQSLFISALDEYTPKQEAAGVPKANLSAVDFPEPPDLYISLSQRHTLQSGPECAESSGVKRKKKKILVVLQISCNVRAGLCFYPNRNMDYRLSLRK